MYSVRCSGASALNTGRVSPADRAHQVARRPPAAQATPVGPNRQRPLPGSRQLVQASSRSRQRFRHAVAARQGSRPPRSSQGDRVVCRRGPRRWSRPYQSIWPVPRGSFYEPAAVHNGGYEFGLHWSVDDGLYWPCSWCLAVMFRPGPSGSASRCEDARDPHVSVVCFGADRDGRVRG